MKPLFVLLIAFAVALLVLTLLHGSVDLLMAGNIAMSAMLVFTAIGHFAFTNGMAMMLPGFIPFKKAMVLATGIIELAAAAGLLIPSLQQLTACLLIVFFIMILPCNIYAAVKKVNYQQGTYTGPGTAYLWFRVPMQLLLVAWVWFFNCYGL